MAKKASSRLRTTVRDMILSMTLIVLPILAVIWPARWLLRADLSEAHARIGTQARRGR